MIDRLRLWFDGRSWQREVEQCVKEYLSARREPTARMIEIDSCGWGRFVWVTIGPSADMIVGGEPVGWGAETGGLGMRRLRVDLRRRTVVQEVHFQ